MMSWKPRKDYEKTKNINQFLPEEYKLPAHVTILYSRFEINSDIPHG